MSGDTRLVTGGALLALWAIFVIFAAARAYHVLPGGIVSVLALAVALMVVGWLPVHRYVNPRRRR